MPTYEYRCNDCGNLFEVFQRIDEDPLTVCERCGGRLRKVFHPAGIVFKGSGFYATDSRSKAKSSGSGKDRADTTSDSGSKKDAGNKDAGSKEAGSKKEASGSGSSS